MLFNAHAPHLVILTFFFTFSTNNLIAKYPYYKLFYLLSILLFINLYTYLCNNL